MATIVLRPNGAGNSSAMTAVGDTPNWKCVDDTTYDNDTTYVNSTTGLPLLDLYTIDASGLPSGAVISNINVICRVKKLAPSGGTNRIAIRIGGTTYYSTNKGATASYTSTSNSWATNPNSGSAWTVADIGNLQIGGELTAGPGNIRYTGVNVTVTYTLPAARNSIFLIG